MPSSVSMAPLFRPRTAKECYTTSQAWVIVGRRLHTMQCGESWRAGTPTSRALMSLTIDEEQRRRGHGSVRLQVPQGPAG